LLRLFRWWHWWVALDFASKCIVKIIRIGWKLKGGRQHRRCSSSTDGTMMTQTTDEWCVAICIIESSPWFHGSTYLAYDNGSSWCVFLWQMRRCRLAESRL
jgi:hypothetical protein